MIYLTSADTYRSGQMPVNVLSVRLKQHAATTVSRQNRFILESLQASNTNT